MDVKFYKEALFGGMTSNAFKLGTVLSCGWFWQRTNGCHTVYRGQDGVLDYDKIQAVMNVADSSISIAGQALAVDTIWHYIRRQLSGCGLESADSDPCIVRIDSAGDMIGDLPNEPSGLSLEKAAGGKFKVRWRYDKSDQEISPAGFYIYIDSGFGFDFETPDATVSYNGGSDHSWTSAALVGGTVYRFCVRAYVSSRQTTNTDYVSGVADSTGPAAITGLIAETEQI